MKRLFVDTNIVLDLLADRKPFSHAARQLFSLADTQQVTLYVSALTIANTYYVLFHSLKQKDARAILQRWKTLVEVLSLDEKIVDLALASPFKDFEDGLQYYTAATHQVDAIITRNQADFKHAKLRVVSAEEYLLSF